MLNLLDAVTGRSAIVIRHAARPPIHSPEGHWTTGITDAGKADAESFATSLAGAFDSFRFFHSPTVRCRQTAEVIAGALEAAGRRVASVRPDDMLGLSYMNVDVAAGFAEADRHGNGFVRAWFSGSVQAGMFKPLAVSRDEHLAFIMQALSTAPADAHLDIHVTHDWNINVLREGIFGLRHEDVGWPGYLDGLALFLDEKGKCSAALAGGHRKEI